MNPRQRIVFLLVLSSLLAPDLRAQGWYSQQGGPLDGLYLLKDSKTARVSSYDTTGGNHDWVDIAPGETKTLAEIQGPAVIRRFYFGPLSGDRMRYRKSVLRIYWDGENTPSVEVPLGDFFGSGLGTLRYIHSQIVDVNPGDRSRDFDAMVNYLPMPFQKSAKVTLENDGQMPQYRVWYHIDYEQFADGVLPANAGMLHAQWRRVVKTTVPEGVPKNTTLGANGAKNTTGKDNFLVLDAEGQGTYVGLFLIVDNVAGGWYGEGDDMIFVDGAKWPPTYSGTGHEEIFNSGCCPDAEFFGAYTGFYLIENLNGKFGGKNQMYKFYVNDPVHFQKSIRVTIEHGHANNYENDYTSTAFWYQKEPHKTFPVLPGVQERLPTWPTGVAETLDKEAKVVEELMGMWAAGKVPTSGENAKQLLAASVEANKAFRELRYPNYIKSVSAIEAVMNRIKQSNP